VNAVAEEVVEAKEERVLTLNDRCDSRECGAAALVKVTGVSGELFFCGHHYNAIEGSEGMNKFAFEIVDERHFLLNENRAKGN
jgi:hypothetical protein